MSVSRARCRVCTARPRDGLRTPKPTTLSPFLPSPCTPRPQAILVASRSTLSPHNQVPPRAAPPNLPAENTRTAQASSADATSARHLEKDVTPRCTRLASRTSVWTMSRTFSVIGSIKRKEFRKSPYLFIFVLDLTFSIPRLPPLP